MLAKPKIDLTGHKYNKMTVLGPWERRQDGRYFWLCRCDCGKEKWCSSGNLKSGNEQTCGCLKGTQSWKHGLTFKPIWACWNHMIQRCYNKNATGYKNYGGRGIKVCEGLRPSVINLVAIVGDKPEPKLSIHRIDNNGNYSCGKCAECATNGWPMNLRWETRTVQSRNRRNTRLVEINGVSKTLAEWAEEWNVPRSLLSSRFYSGQPLLPIGPRTSRSNMPWMKYAHP